MWVNGNKGSFSVFFFCMCVRVYVWICMQLCFRSFSCFFAHYLGFKCFIFFSQLYAFLVLNSRSAHRRIHSLIFIQQIFFSTFYIRRSIVMLREHVCVCVGVFFFVNFFLLHCGIFRFVSLHVIPAALVRCLLYVISWEKKLLAFFLQFFFAFLSVLMCIVHNLYDFWCFCFFFLSVSVFAEFLYTLRCSCHCWWTLLLIFFIMFWSTDLNVF